MAAFPTSPSNLSVAPVGLVAVSALQQQVTALALTPWPQNHWQHALWGLSLLTPSFEAMLEQLLGVKVGLTLLSVATPSPSLVSPAEGQLQQHLHLSEDDNAVLHVGVNASWLGQCFTVVLGPSPQVASPTQWQPTPLEAFLADRLLNHVSGWLLEHCINPNAVDCLEPDAEQAIVVWGLHALNGTPLATNQPLAWLALQCPLPLLPSQQAGTNHYSQWLTQQAFMGSTQVTLVAGKTSLPLQQLKGIEPDALILLEESHACQLALVHPATGQWLGFDIPPAYQGWLEVFPISAEELEQALALQPTSSPPTRPTEPTAMSSYPQQASGADPAQLWDHLLIDVYAQFEPTRLPLQHLKQMSEGLVVDVGSLLDNKVSLVANGKALAQGQLVVVGDRLGVLVTALLGPRDAIPSAAAVGSSQTLVPLAQAAGSGSTSQAVATMAKPQHPVEGVDDALVLKAESLGLNVPEMVAMAEQQGLTAAEAIAQAVALHDDDDPDSEVARANAMMAEVDEVLNSPD